MNLNLIQAKLINYGITYEDYRNQTGNFVGNISVPTALLSYNKDLNVEDAFYLVANKVFEAANILAYGVPLKASINFKKVVGYEAYRDFKAAIYEEINQRWMSNAFVEFANAGSMSFANISQTQPVAGGYSLFEWVNPLSQQKIRNIDWLSFDLLKQGDDVFLFTNMENLNLAPSNKTRVLQAGMNGSLVLSDRNEFANNESLDLTNKTLEETIAELTKQIERINVNTDTLTYKADISFVVDAVKALPLSEQWDANKIYQIPQIVYYSGKLYWNVANDNLGHVPGGVTGLEWWEELTNIIPAEKSYELAYKAGTNTLKSFANPNNDFYFEIKELIDNQIDNFDKLKQFALNKFPILNLKDTDFQEFIDNFFNLDLVKIQEVFYNETARTKLYSKGELSLFFTYSEFNTFITNYNLDNPNNQITNNDYYELSKSMSTDGCLMIGKGTWTGVFGSNFIEERHLPIKNWYFSIRNLGDFGRRWFHQQIFAVENKNNKNFFIGKSENVEYNLLANIYTVPENEIYKMGNLKSTFEANQYNSAIKTFNAGEEYTTIGTTIQWKLNDRNVQEKFVPYGMAVYCIKWNKDIYNNSSSSNSSDLKWFVNIADINLVLNNQANLNLKHKVEELEKKILEIEANKADKTELNDYLTKLAFDTFVNGIKIEIDNKVDKTILENEIDKINDNFSLTNQKIDDVNTKLDTQIIKIDNNTVNINNANNSINNVENNLNVTNTKLDKVIEDLKNSSFSNYRGVWNNTTNYLIGDIVSINNDFYIAKLDNVNKNPQTNNNEWALLNFTIDTSDFVSKQELKLTDDKANINTTNINTINNELVTIKSDVEVNKEHLNENDGKLTVLETNQANITNKVNNINRYFENDGFRRLVLFSNQNLANLKAVINDIPYAPCEFRIEIVYDQHHRYHFYFQTKTNFNQAGNVMVYNGVFPYDYDTINLLNSDAINVAMTNIIVLRERNTMRIKFNNVKSGNYTDVYVYVKEF